MYLSAHDKRKYHPYNYRLKATNRDGISSKMSQNRVNNYPIGDFIAKCLLVRICGKYKIAIADMVRQKMETVDDAVFCKKMEKILTRFSLYSCELEQKILRRFGEEYTERFNSGITNDGRIEYDNMIGNRHGIAHGRDIHFTIADISQAHQHGKRVLSAFAFALDLDVSI